MSIETNDRIHNATMALLRCTCELGDLANALYVTGNDKLSDRLAAIASTVETSRDEIRQAWGQECADRLRQTQESTANLLEGVLAGISVREQSP